MRTQNAQILAHLRRGWLTPLDALRRYGAMRLAARVADLKRAGHDIERVMVTRNGRRFAAYRLAS